MLRGFEILICKSQLQTVQSFRPRTPRRAVFVPVSGCIRIVVPDVAPTALSFSAGGTIAALEAFPAHFTTTAATCKKKKTFNNGSTFYSGIET